MTCSHQKVEFALAGPRDKVSDPIVGEGNARLWKVLDFVAERSEPFDDPAVQQVIRNHMERAVMDRLLDQTVRRSRERTEVWQPPDLRRR
jgi:hypothetical protein